jgi:hypothetical protein
MEEENPEEGRRERCRNVGKKPNMVASCNFKKGVGPEPPPRVQKRAQKNFEI